MALDRDRKALLRKLLKDARLEAGLTQVEVATKLKVPQSFIAKVEQGERKISFIEVLDLCKALGTDAKDLIKLLG
jgi:transcriptional regulator with XRE-family HTH domain